MIANKHMEEKAYRQLQQLHLELGSTWPSASPLSPPASTPPPPAMMPPEEEESWMPTMADLDFGSVSQHAVDQVNQLISDEYVDEILITLRWTSPSLP